VFYMQRCVVLFACVQMEYVRCSEEVRALQALKQNSSSLAVALPGAESRALQSRAQDGRLLEKLLRRLAKLQVDLGYDEPLAADSSLYREGLAAVRDQQLRRIQRDIERDVALLGNIMQERQQSGASSSLTRSQQNRAKRRRKRIRQLVDSIATWQQLDLPSSTVTQQLPDKWSDQVVSGLLKGTFPWKQSSTGDVPAVLAEQFREACAEVRAGVVSIPCVVCKKHTCGFGSAVVSQTSRHCAVRHDRAAVVTGSRQCLV
jgi:hypothetical protein